MKQWKKRGLILSMAGMLAVTSLSGCQQKSVDNDKVLATIGDTEISYGLANFYARMVQSRYENYYTDLTGSTPSEFWTQNFLGQVYEESVKSDLMDTLVELCLVSQHAEEYDIVLTEEEQKAIEKAAADFEEQNDLETKKLVSGYAKYIAEYLTMFTIQKKMDAPMKEGVDEEVSDEEAAQKSMKYVFFSYTKEDEGDSEEKSEDDSEMSDDEKEELKTEAEKFAKELKDSEDKDIDALAKESDLEVETVTFDSETRTPDTALIEEADQLKENESTDVVETDSGLYVGVVTSLLDRKATDEKKESILQNRKDEQYDSLIEEWKKETEITVDNELWQGIDFADHGVSDKDGREDDPAKDSSSEEPQTTDNSGTDETTDK